MTKAEIISQLKSLRDSTASFISRDSDPIFRKDIEALDAVIDFLTALTAEERCVLMLFRGLTPERRQGVLTLMRESASDEKGRKRCLNTSTVRSF